MPQLDQLMHVYASQLFWLGIVLAILYFGVGKLMLPQIEATMDDRNAHIASDLAAAKTAQAQAEGMEEAWRLKMQTAQSAAQAVILKAKDKAAGSAATQIAKTDAVLATQLETAHASIAKASADAMTQINAVAAENAQHIVEKIAGLKIAPAAALSAVKEVMTNA